MALRGRIFPAAGRRAAVLQVRAWRVGGGGYDVVRRIRLPRSGGHNRVAVNLSPGRWQIKTRYVDPRRVARGDSRARSLSVG